MRANEFAAAMGGGYANGLADGCDRFADALEFELMALVARVSREPGLEATAKAEAWEIVVSRFEAMRIAADIRDGSADAEDYELAELIASRLEEAEG